MGIEYTMLMQGSKNYFEKSVDPLFNHYTPLFEELEWVQSSSKMKCSKALFIDKKISNNAAGFLANFVLGTVIFVAGWSSTKLLDHFFKDKLLNKTDELSKHLQEIFNLEKDKSIEIRHVVWFEDTDLTIVIRLIVNGNQQENNKKLLLQAHKNSIDWINNHGKNAPVHSYLVKNGYCNLEPILYESLYEMDAKEGGKKLKKRIKKFQFSNNDLIALKSKLKEDNEK